MVYQQYNPLFDYRNVFRGKSLLTKLILINIFVWIGINIFKVGLFLFKIEEFDIIQWLGIPSNINILLIKPWTVFTYMFTHEKFMHIFFNMILLYIGGYLFTQYLDERKLLSVYILGGVCGASFFIAAYNFFPVFSDYVSASIAIGASASVLAVFVAIAVYIPNYTVHLLLIGRIKLIYIALAFLMIDILSIDKGNPGGHLAHLGGALWGYIYTLQLRKGRDMSYLTSFIFNLKNFIYPKPKIKIKYKNFGKPLSDDEYNSIRAKKQKYIDSILDKIAKSGYDSLTREEKDFLFKSSNRNN